jgi:BioD-like phosphotransacetylase family protein
MKFKSLYVTSVERFSGKTAVCLALARRFQADGYRVGYLKPVSLQPFRVGGHIADEDAAFVKEILRLEAPAWDLSPVVITPEFLRERLRSHEDINLLDKVKAASETAGAGRDVLLLEGGASLREGYVAGLPTTMVAETLGSNVLVVVKYRDEVRLLDDVLATQYRLRNLMCGVIINRVPTEAAAFVKELVKPFLEKRGLYVYAILPEQRGLESLTVGELVKSLEADVLTRAPNLNALVESLTVGAMTVEAALSRFRQQTNKAVITGGDRTDIQLAALETSTTCLILTGNLQPSPLIVKQAEEFGVAILLVPTNTMETIEKIERIFGKTRLQQADKLRKFEQLMAANLDLPQLYRCLSLKE